MRENVEVIKRRLSLVLKALGSVATANPAKAHEQLPALVIFLSTRLLLSVGHHYRFGCSVKFSGSFGMHKDILS